MNIRGRAGNYLEYSYTFIISAIIFLFFYHVFGNTYPNHILVPKIFFGLFVLYSFFLIRNNKLNIAIFLFSIFLFSIYFWTLKNIKITPNGIGGDNYFSLAMVNIFRSSNTSQDFTYANLSSFYPFYYHYAIAKASLLFNISLEKSLVYGSFLSILILPNFTYWLYRKSFNKKEAFLLTIASFATIGAIFYFRKTYEAITLIAVIPWWIAYIYNKNNSPILGGIMGGLIFSSYYYWFFPLVIGSIFLIYLDYKDRRLNIKYYSILATAFLIISSFYLIPYIMDLIFIGSSPQQNKWFQIYHLDNPLSNIQNTYQVLLFLGFIFILRESRKEHFKILLFSCLVWYAFCYIGILIGKPLLIFKTNLLSELVLILGFAYYSYKEIEKYSLIKVEWLMFIAIFLIGIYHLNQAHQSLKSKEVKTSLSYSTPKKLKNKFINNNLHNKVILADNREARVFNATLNTFLFAEYKAHYSHPSALYDNRLDFIEYISNLENSSLAIYLLANNKYNKVDYIWTNNKKEIRLAKSIFPHNYTTQTYNFNRVVKTLDKTDIKNLYSVPKSPLLPKNLTKEENALIDCLINQPIKIKCF